MFSREQHLIVTFCAQVKSSGGGFHRSLALVQEQSPNLEPFGQLLLRTYILYSTLSRNQQLRTKNHDPKEVGGDAVGVAAASQPTSARMLRQAASKTTMAPVVSHQIRQKTVRPLFLVPACACASGGFGDRGVSESENERECVRVQSRCHQQPYPRFVAPHYRFGSHGASGDHPGLRGPSGGGSNSASLVELATMNGLMDGKQMSRREESFVAAQMQAE